MAHQQGGALGPGSSSPSSTQQLTAAVAFLVLALLVTLIARPRRPAPRPTVGEPSPKTDSTATEAETLARTAA